MHYKRSVQFSSVSQSCPTLCDPLDCSTPDLPVDYQVLKFTQTHVIKFTYMTLFNLLTICHYFRHQKTEVHGGKTTFPNGKCLDLSRFVSHLIKWHLLCVVVCCAHSVMLDSCDTMDCSPLGFYVRGLSQARILEQVAVSHSRGSSQPRNWLLCLLHWQEYSLPLHHLYLYFFMSSSRVKLKMSNYTTSLILHIHSCFLSPSLSFTLTGL